MNKDVRIAKQLIKIAKQLISAFPNPEQYINNYKEQHVDQNLLYQLYDKYTDEISIDLLAGAKQHSKTITTISLKKWLVDNGYEDWSKGRKYDALYDYFMNKLNENKYQMIKETQSTYIISPQKLIQEAEKQLQEESKNYRSFTGGLPSKQEIIKIYKENIN